MTTDNKDIVKEVRKDIGSRNLVIERLYNDKELKTTIRQYIISRGGSADEISDIFTTAIMAFIKQCYRPHFQLKNDIKAYIFSISKYEWIRISKGKKLVQGDEAMRDMADDVDIEETVFKIEKKKSLQQAMTALDDKCRKLLTLWANSMRMREIALQMSYKSEGMARKKKHECIGKLKRLIKDV